MEEKQNRTILAADLIITLTSLAVRICLTVGLAYGTSEPCLIAQGHGYACQEFTVTTEDGYLLGLQRIPHGRVDTPSDTAATARRPVLLQHGILVDGTSWMLNARDQSLPFLLADSGFDVWIANSRGTRPSRAHKFLNADKHRAYWDWTWDELANFEIPAFVDFVYAQTGFGVHYVGHSLGTLTAMAFLSQQILVEKMRYAALLCPIAHLSHIGSPILQMAAREYLPELLNIFGNGEFVPRSQDVDRLLKSICSHPGVNCEDLLAAISGRDCCINSSMIDLLLSYEPQSTSTKNIVHLAQMVRSNTVPMYNYGNILTNALRYGKAHPPVYNLSNIPLDLPLFVGYGGQDALADIEDVELLLSELKLLQHDKLKVQFVDEFGHLDFVMGSNVKQKVYTNLIAFFNDLPISS